RGRSLLGAARVIGPKPEAVARLLPLLPERSTEGQRGADEHWSAVARPTGPAHRANASSRGRLDPGAPHRAALMSATPVGPQDVHAEVADGVSPDGVHVIRVTRGVVVLHEQARPLDSVVVGSPRLKAASPCEVEREERRALHLGRLAIGDLVW